MNRVTNDSRNHEVQPGWRVDQGHRKALYGSVQKFLGPIFYELVSQRGLTMVEGHMVQDHVHMLIKIPPKYAISDYRGAIAVARQFSGLQRNFNGDGLWARGCAVSTVGFEEAQIKAYIKNQEQLDETQGCLEEEKGGHFQLARIHIIFPKL